MYVSSSETESHYVAAVGLELTLQSRLPWTPQTSLGICLVSGRIKGLHHHNQHLDKWSCLVQIVIV